MSDPPIRLAPEFVEYCERVNAEAAKAAVQISIAMQPLLDAWRSDVQRFVERVNQIMRETP